MAASKVATVGIKRESGYLYYLDKQGDISRVVMARGGGTQARRKPEKVAKAGVKREDGFLYFIDKRGDVCRTKMARRGGAGRRNKTARRAAPRRRSTARKTTRARRGDTARGNGPQEGRSHDAPPRLALALLDSRLVRSRGWT
jgi:hypothetical protein